MHPMYDGRIHRKFHLIELHTHPALKANLLFTIAEEFSHSVDLYLDFDIGI